MPVDLISRADAEDLAVSDVRPVRELESCNDLLDDRKALDSIQDYRPVWVTLTPCTRDVGGLAIAVGQNRRGYLHNVGKPKGDEETYIRAVDPGIREPFEGFADYMRPGMRLVVRDGERAVMLRKAAEG